MGRGDSSFDIRLTCSMYTCGAAGPYEGSRTRPTCPLTDRIVRPPRCSGGRSIRRSRRLNSFPASPQWPARGVGSPWTRCSSSCRSRPLSRCRRCGRRHRQGRAPLRRASRPTSQGRCTPRHATPHHRRQRTHSFRGLLRLGNRGSRAGAVLSPTRPAQVRAAEVGVGGDGEDRREMAVVVHVQAGRTSQFIRVRPRCRPPTKYM